MPPKSNNIARIRRLLRLSQSDLATLMADKKYLGRKLDFTTISSHENARRGMSQDEINAYAAVFKVPVHVLFTDITNDDELRRQLRDRAVLAWQDDDLTGSLSSGVDD